MTTQTANEIAREKIGVCYRNGAPTIADYNEAISDLLAAKHQLQSGSLMGCSVCGDSGHAAQDGCHHDPLILARKWAQAERIWNCYHCGFIATNESEAREHFGAKETDPAKCLTAAHDEAVRELVDGLERARMLIGAGKGDDPNPVVRECNVNQAWHVLDALIAKHRAPDAFDTWAEGLIDE